MLKRLVWLLWLLACLGAGPAMAQPKAAPVAPTITVASAQTVEAEAPAFPNAQSVRTVPLPDDWSQSRPGSGGPVWYRMGFQVAAGSASVPLGAWIERACGQLEVQLNGSVIHAEASTPAARSAHCNHPLLVSLPPALLLAGQNQLDVKLTGLSLDQVASRRRAAGMSSVLIGPVTELWPVQAGRTLWQSGLAQALSLGMAFLGVFMLLQGWRNRRDSHVSYFGLVLLAQAALAVPLWVRYWPLQGVVVEFLAACVLPMATWAAVQFLLRHAGRREKLADAVLPAQAVLVPLSLIVMGPSNLHVAVQFWSTLFIIEVLVAAGLHLSTQWTESRRSFWVMTILLAALALGELTAYFGVHASEPALVAVGSAVGPLLLMLVGLRLVQQRARALESAETSRALLEQRVAEVKAEIEANYRQLSELRVMQVTDRERKRIAADLHDDLGAKLLTIVHTSESERISTLAREALEEMRLSVRGLTGKPVRLEDALGDWRAEVISRLGQAGIEAVWTMPTDDLPQTLPARAFVQTTRIIREAVNNIIKHSGASQCAVRCNVSDGDFQLVIQDNGKGISVEVDGRLDRGHGLSSMKGRAKQLQGQCLVESGPGYGTVIRLTIPLEPAAQPA